MTYLIQERLKQYSCHSKQEELNALKEIYQEIALAGLARSDFFKLAAFQGGTCLRIVHQLKRFSEDLDFILLQPQTFFQWHLFLQAIELEFQSFGITLTTKERSQAGNAIKMAFLKDNSFGKILELHYDRLPSDEQTITIKLEIDISPPEGSLFESTFLAYPYPFPIVIQDLSSLFASKCHALLCRPYLKGRDWFDFLWYISKNVPINFHLLKNALQQTGPYQNKGLSIDAHWIMQEFEKKILSIDWKAARLDIENFLRFEERKFVIHWTTELFIQQLKKMTFY